MLAHPVNELSLWRSTSEPRSEMEFWDLRQSLSNWSPTDRLDRSSGGAQPAERRLLRRRRLLLSSAPSSTSEIRFLRAVVFLTTWDRTDRYYGN